MEGNFFSILEEAVGSPDVVQPANVQDPVLLTHVLGQAEAWVPPTLC